MNNHQKTRQEQKYALGIHTTTPELGLVMSNFVDDTRFQVWNLGRDVSSHIHQYLVDFILPQSWPDLQLIAVAKGPGGFTGTRIGMVLARTLGQQLSVPVLPISTLAAVAWNGKSQNPQLPDTIAVEMPAQRGKVFGAIYQINVEKSGIKALLADQVFTLEAWKGTLNDYPIEHELIRATSNLGVTVTSILQ